MRNKFSTEATTEVPTTPPISKADPSPPNWTAIAAIVISIITFFKSLFTDAKATNNQKATSFEANYGNAVRDALRDFEKNIKELRSFTLKPARPIDKLKEEIEPLKEKWIGAADDLLIVLEEVDSCVDLVQPKWNAAFSHFASRAELGIEAITGPEIDTEEKIVSKAKSIYSNYQSGILDIRVKLQKQREHYSNSKISK